MRRAALAAGALLIATTATSPSPQPAGYGGRACPSTVVQSPFDELTGSAGSVDVMVAGERRPRCGLRLREHHRALAVAAGPDGLVYVAEDSSGWDDDAHEHIDTGAVDVFRADGKLVRRLIGGVVGPSALAVDDRNRLFVLNSGDWTNRGHGEKTRASIAIFEPGATAPSRTIALLPGERPVGLALTPDGDAIVADSLQYGSTDENDGRVARYRAADGSQAWSVGVPHPPLRTTKEIRAMTLEGLRVLGSRSVVALYGPGSTPQPFFVELAQSDGHVVRKVAVPNSTALAIDRGGRVLVATDAGILAYGAGSIGGVRTGPPSANAVIATARDGTVWYETDRSIFAFNAGGQHIAEFDVSGPAALVDAPRTSSPLSDESPRPRPAASPTSGPPTLADVTATVRGMQGIAYDRVMVRGFTQQPPAIDIGWSAAQRLAPGSLLEGDVELVHVAILGPYARLANRDESVVEIVDCVHRTVVSLSPRRDVARYDLPQRAIGPDDEPEPTNGPFQGAQITVETRREAATSIDGVHIESYSIATGATQMRGAGPTNRDRRFDLSNEQVAIGDVPGLPVACAAADVGPPGLFPTYDWAFGNGFESERVAGFAKAGAHVTRLGPSVPNRLVVAYVGTQRLDVYAVFTGNIRPLSDRDAVLFALPNGTRLDEQAPTLVR